MLRAYLIMNHKIIIVDLRDRFQYQIIIENKMLKIVITDLIKVKMGIILSIQVIHKM